MKDETARKGAWWQEEQSLAEEERKKKMVSRLYNIMLIMG